MNDLVTEFFNFVSHPWTPWVFSGLIFIIAFILGIRLRYYAFPIIKSLEDSKNLIQKSENFFYDYEEINQKLKKDKVVGNIWSKFTETLVFDKNRHKIYSPHRPQLYFNYTAIIASRINLRFYQSVPNLLVGLGLLFTFIGLVAALYFASRGVQAEDINEAQQSLHQLLQAATFKFVTSIAGLFCSIVFSFWEKRCLHNLGVKLENICRVLENNLITLIPEQLSYNQLIQSKLQTEQLQNIDANFQNWISQSIQPLLISVNALNEKFVKTSQDVLEKIEVENKNKMENINHNFHAINTSIKDLGLITQDYTKRVTEVNQTALDYMVKEFITALQGETGKQLDKLANILTDTIQNLSDTFTTLKQENQRIAKSVKQFVDQVERFQNKIIDSATDFNEKIVSASRNSSEVLLGSVGQLKDTIDSASNNFEEKISESTGIMGENIRLIIQQVTTLHAQLKDTLQENTTNIQCVSASLQEMSNTINSSTQNFTLAVEPLSRVFTNMQDLSFKLQITISNLNTLTQTLQNTEQGVVTTWQKYGDHFDGINIDMTRIFEVLNAGLRQYIEYTQQINSNLTKSLDLLRGAINEFTETFEEHRLTTRH